MGKFKEPDFEFSLTLPPRGSRNLLRALHGQLRAAIVDGRLKPGLRLPATRAFADTYGISRNTAMAVYDLLLSEGYLVTRRKAGTYVADVRLDARGVSNQRPVSPAAKTVPRKDRRLVAYWRDVAAPAPEPMPVAARDFQLGVPDLSFFRADIWRRLHGRTLRAASKAPAVYADPRGSDALRDAAAKHVSFARAVACTADDLIVTAGAQQAFDLLARILVTPGRTVVAVEDPGYPPLRSAFAAAGATLAAVPVDSEGLVVERLPDDARVICVTPSHQFPLGMAMSMRRRAELLEFARTRHAVIVEDDYDSEFRLGDRPLDALQTLDRAESVFYVGTFSKSLFPAIRLGFVVTPPWAQRALAAAKQAADWHCNTLAQDTLAAFIGEGHLARHVRKMRDVYGARRKLVLDVLERDFGDWLEPVSSDAGLHLSALARRPADFDAITKRVAEQGVRIETLGRYALSRRSVALARWRIGARRKGLAFGYGALDERAIVEGLDLLRRAWT